MTTAERVEIAEKILKGFFNEGYEDMVAIHKISCYVANCLTDDEDANKVMALGMLNSFYEGLDTIK